MLPPSAGGVQVETMSIPRVRDEKSLMKKRNEESVRAEVMPSDSSRVRSSSASVKNWDRASRRSRSMW